MRVYTATIHHRHGEDIRLSHSMKDLTAQIYAYVKGNWEEFMEDEDGECTTIPKDHQKAIDDYFKAAGEEGIGDEHEWYETDSCDVKEPKVMTLKIGAILDVVVGHLNSLGVFDFMDEGTEKTLSLGGDVTRDGFKLSACVEGAGVEEKFELKFKLVSTKYKKRGDDEADEK